MDRNFNVLNVVGYDADALKEFFGDDLQIMFAEDFFSIPEWYTYKNLTVDAMIGFGMIDKLNKRVLEKTISHWDENQQEYLGAWEDQSLGVKVQHFEEIAYNWS